MAEINRRRRREQAEKDAEAAGLGKVDGNVQVQVRCGASLTREIASARGWRVKCIFPNAGNYSCFLEIATEDKCAEIEV